MNEKRADSEYFIKGYDVALREDKRSPTGVGGVVIVYCKNGLSVTTVELDDVSSKISSQLAVGEILLRNRKICIMAMYRSPNVDDEEESINNIKRAIEAISKCEAGLCLGDLNNPEINWMTMSTEKYNLAEFTEGGSGPSNLRAEDLIDTIACGGFSQLQYESTYLPAIAKSNKGGFD